MARMLEESDWISKTTVNNVLRAVIDRHIGSINRKVEILRNKQKC